MNYENTSVQNAHIIKSANSRRYSAMENNSTEESRRKFKRKSYAQIYAERVAKSNE